MRLKIVLLVLLLVPLGIQFGFAQQNTYFDQQPVWKVYTQNAHEYPCVRHMNRNQFLGTPVAYDTLIYYPVFERYVLDFGWESDLEPYPHCNGMQTVDSLFKGYVRSYGKQVFFRTSFNAVEYLLYDFSLVVGDTLPFNQLLQNNVLTVTQVDSILVSDGNYWKVFTLEGNNYVSQLVEGVGSSAGFLEALEKPYNVNHSLQCYSQSGQNYFPETVNPDCIFFLGLSSFKPEIDVYPNPCSELLRISVKSDFPDGLWRIIAANGKEIAHGTLSGQQADIETGSWDSGVYFLECYADHGTTFRQKIIKE
ncbi:hypothetical protein D3C87_97920 [compost metagenome]